jgi:hypothetical protein
MAIDIDALDLANESLDVGDVQNWQEPSAFAPPPPAGEYRAVIDDIVDARSFEARGEACLELTINYRIHGGEYDGRAVTFQRVNTFKRERDKSSTLLDFFKSAGVPSQDLKNISVKDAAKLAQTLADRGGIVKFYLDWQAYSVPARNQTLIALTGANDYDEARVAADDEAWKGARKAALIATSYRDFPDNGRGGKKPSLVCPLTGEKVEAKAVVKRFMES